MVIEKKSRLPALLLICAAMLGFNTISLAETPAGQDRLQVTTGTPKRHGDSLFSYTVEWRIDDGMTHRGTGLFYIKGPDSKKPSSNVTIAKKMVESLNDGMVQQYPSLRGVVAENKPDSPEVSLSNKAGFSFTNVTFRDYANETMVFNLPAGDFASTGVDVALDLVLSADVDYIEGFSTRKGNEHHQGIISVSINGAEPVVIQTEDKTTGQLEQELAAALNSAIYASEPLFPNLKDGDKRNFKPFDGGEVQLMNLPAKSITVQIDDPAIGVLTKFRYRDENKSSEVFTPVSFMYILGLVTVGFVLYLLWNGWIKKQES